MSGHYITTLPAMTVAALLTRRESFPLAAALRLLSYLRPGCRDLYLKVRCSYIKTTAERQTGRRGHACPAGWAESSRAVIDGPGKREQEDALGHRFSQPGTGEPQELGLKKTYSGVKGFNVQGGGAESIRKIYQGHCLIPRTITAECIISYHHLDRSLASNDFHCTCIRNILTPYIVIDRPSWCVCRYYRVTWRPTL
ncbi:hypothetical protein TEQG_07407 [Trichophyton equinum CBS 127.97]|uniref:Uncharacterized protein n=1 Tax=Trichophyton equinum (strain ATCC MYA-4606 / CBS 127.97) TaxID=559882 RepID=F2Q2Q7_TRIEC|nr:hypothetical protein TEQG_07407 [Trichophyton equinum CBS 127.97]